VTEIAQLTSKGLRTRDRIVDVAAELFFTQGMTSTTLDDVKAAASISSSQLYHYFDSKDDLVQTIVVRHTENIVTEQELLLRSMQRLDGLRDWAVLVVDLFRSFDCRGGCPIGSLGSEVAEHDELARQAVAASLGRWEAALLAGLTNLSESGELASTADAEALAVVLIVALQGGLLLGKIHRSSRWLEVALANAIDHVASFSVAAPAARVMTPQYDHGEKVPARSVGHYPERTPFWPVSGDQIISGDRSDGRRTALRASIMRLSITDARS
jgi:TetR/AcrR family transcriptional repressor of nem operon